MRQKVTIGFVAILHIIVILGVIILPKWLNRMKPEKMPPDAMMVSLVAPAPQVQEVAPEVKPAPPPPAPEPDSVAPPPPKPKPKKKKIEISKKRVVRNPVQKPVPKISADDLKKELELSKTRVTRSSSTAQTPLPAWYYTSVRDILYSAWAQPASLSASSGHRVKVQLTVHRDGRIGTKNIIRASGQPEMDQSVKAALASVTKLNALPPQYRGSTVDITITFELNRG